MGSMGGVYSGEIRFIGRVKLREEILLVVQLTKVECQLFGSTRTENLDPLK